MTSTVQRGIAFLGLAGLGALLLSGGVLAVRSAGGPQPVVSLVDASLPEGDAGLAELRVPVHRTGETRTPVRVRWAIVGGTALIGSDVLGGGGTLTLDAGVTQGAIRLRVRGDRRREPAETVRVRIRAVEGGMIGDGVARAEIADDDAPGGPVVVAVGDVACDPSESESSRASGGCRHPEVARVARSLRPVAVLGLGDLQYVRGTAAAFREVFVRAWRDLLPRIRPVPGNHEYGTPGAAGFHETFGAAAGPAGRTWSSFDVGSWHVVALDSSCDEVGGCGPGSPQERWLRRDLAAHPGRCTLAFWHHPRFSSGAEHGDDARTAGLWQALADAGADVVLTGHEHLYERLGPLDPSGRPSPQGIRSFVAGTGGRSLYRFGDARPGSEARVVAYGVLVLRLGEGRYAWELRGIDGRALDRGSDACR